MNADELRGYLESLTTMNINELTTEIDRLNNMYDTIGLAQQENSIRQMLVGSIVNAYAWAKSIRAQEEAEA